MVPYLTFATFKDRTIIPAPDVDHVEATSPGFIDKRLVVEQSRIDARLRKRYAVPFAEPVPEIVLGWLTDIVTEVAYRKRGVDPNDAQASEYAADAQRAREELLEAANAVDGLFELPLRQDLPGPSGVSESEGPFGYSEVGQWLSSPRCAARSLASASSRAPPLA
jgi:hypothetical protein